MGESRLFIVLVVLAVLVIGGAAFWVLRPTPRHTASPTASAAAVAATPARAAPARIQQGPQPTPVPNPTTAELERLRAENARLARQLAARPPVPTFTTPPASMPPAPPPAPTGVQVSGSAYVVHESGQSDILRGFHVTLIRNTVQPRALQSALATVVQNCKEDAAKQRADAATERKQFPELGADDPTEKLYADTAKEDDANAQKYSQILARVSSPVDSAEALRLVGQSHYVNVMQGLAASAEIAATTTDVQGAYKFASAPRGAYIFAMFDTKDGFLIWALPVQGPGSKDLFNDTALSLK